MVIDLGNQTSLWLPLQSTHNNQNHRGCSAWIWEACERVPDGTKGLPFYWGCWQGHMGLTEVTQTSLTADHVLSSSSVMQWVFQVTWQVTEEDSDLGSRCCAFWKQFLRGWLCVWDYPAPFTQASASTRWLYSACAGSLGRHQARCAWYLKTWDLGSYSEVACWMILSHVCWLCAVTWITPAKIAWFWLAAELIMHPGSRC